MSKHNPDSGLERLQSIPVPVSVQVCQRKLSLNDLLKWTVGTVLTFETEANSPLTLAVADHQFGDGLPVKVGSNMGILVRRVGSLNP